VFKDSICHELVTNFRNVITKAFKHNLYTHVVLNTPEANIAAQSLGLKNVKVITYSHQESYTLDVPACYSSPTFSPEYLHIIRNLDGIGIGCQSAWVESCVKKFSPNVESYVLPFFFPKDETPTVNQNGTGVLFIGRWEDRKNPKAFIKLIADTKLPAKVLTNKTGHKKFEEALKEIDATYEIRSDIIGQEKTDFISSAKIAFCPNKVETGPYSVFESMLRMPTVVPSNVGWINNFNGYPVVIVDLKSSDCASKVLELYNSNKPYSPPKIEDLNNVALEAWSEFINCVYDETKSVMSYKNAIMSQRQTGKQFKPIDLIPDSIYNQTSLNQLTEVFLCNDVNVSYDENNTYISMGDIKPESVETEIVTLF
jgi:glycosyltransferase involved in cell wall biosynthesis